MKNKIKAGDLIECEAAIFSDFKVGQKVEVHADERGLYVLGGPGANAKLYLHEPSISKYTDEAFAMCLGHSFIKRQHEVPELPLRGSELTKELLKKQKYVLCLVSDISDDRARDWPQNICVTFAFMDKGFTIVSGKYAKYAVPVDNNGKEITEIESC